MLGPIAKASQLERVLGYIDAGRKEGARLVTGGSRTRIESGGFFIEPTVFDGVRNDMRIAQEEIFGPVLSTITFRTPEEAVAIANASTYGLSGAIWTQNLEQGPHARSGVALRQRRGQCLLRRCARHDRALRRLQAVGVRARQVAARARQVHATQDDLGQALGVRRSCRMPADTTPPADPRRAGAALGELDRATRRAQFKADPLVRQRPCRRSPARTGCGSTTSSFTTWRTARRSWSTATSGRMLGMLSTGFGFTVAWCCRATGRRDPVAGGLFLPPHARQRGRTS